MSGEIRRSRRQTATKHAVIAEALENRQLLSFTVEVRAADGSQAIAVTTPGQVVHMNVFVDIQGHSSDLSQDGVQDLFGSFIGTGVGFGPLGGSLAAQNIMPFSDLGSTPGTVQDLNGDGNPDVGGTDPNNASDYFFAHSSSVQTGASEFKVGTLTYTVDQINSGGEVDVNFVLKPIGSGGGFAAIWREDGLGRNETEEAVDVGSPVKITDNGAQPHGPIALADAAQAITGQQTRIHVLGNDVDFSGTIIPATVSPTSLDHGGTTVVDTTTGDILYTSAPGFFGTETFSYTVEDSNDDVSPAATVTVTVQPPLPMAADDTANVLVNNSVVIPVLSNDGSAIGLVPTSVTLTTQTTHGTAVVNSDGTVTYTPNTNFIGSDTFDYTVADTLGVVADAATVTINVGVEVSSNKGANKNVSFLDGDGTNAVTSLNRGTADVYFSGTGSALLSHSKYVVTGTNLGIGAMTLTGTTAASTLTITGHGGNGVVSVAGVTDTGVLGKIIAPVGNLTGAFNLSGVTTMQFASALGATIQIGGAPANLTVNCGTLFNSSITAAADNLSLHSGALTNSNITAAVGRAVQIAGNTSGSNLVFSGAVASVNIVGSLSNANFSFGAPTRGTVSLGRLSVAGSITNLTMSAAGDISSISAASMSGSTISAGATAGTTLANATGASLGANKIGSIRLTAKASTFSNSSILAEIINSASLGVVTTANGGVLEGLAAVVFKSVTASVNGSVLHLSAKQLVAPGMTFSDFVIVVP